jgi:hypothetical protein
MGFAAEAGFFLVGGEGAFRPKKGVMLHPRAMDFQENKSSASSIPIVSYCKYDRYFNKYDMYSIVGIDKKTYGEGIGITYIHTQGLSTNQRSYILRTHPCRATTPMQS